MYQYGGSSLVMWRRRLCGVVYFVLVLQYAVYISYVRYTEYTHRTSTYSVQFTSVVLVLVLLLTTNALEEREVLVYAQRYLRNQKSREAASAML